MSYAAIVAKLLSIIDAVLTIWQQKKLEERVIKSHDYDTLSKVNEQLVQAYEIDTKPHPRDESAILDRM